MKKIIGYTLLALVLVLSVYFITHVISSDVDDVEIYCDYTVPQNSGFNI